MPFAHLLEASRCHLMLSPQLLQQWLRRRYSHVLARCSPRRARAEGDANARATNQVVRLARQAANAAPAIVRTKFGMYRRGSSSVRQSEYMHLTLMTSH